MANMTDGKSSVTVSFALPRGSYAAPQGLGVKLGSKSVEALAVPFCAVDGTEHVCSWKEPTRIDVEPGSHKIETFDRLKGIPLKRRKGRTDITLTPGEHRSITAQIGQFKTKLVVA